MGSVSVLTRYSRSSLEIQVSCCFANKRAECMNNDKGQTMVSVVGMGWRYCSRDHTLNGVGMSSETTSTSNPENWI